MANTCSNRNFACKSIDIALTKSNNFIYDNCYLNECEIRQKKNWQKIEIQCSTVDSNGCANNRKISVDGIRLVNQSVHVEIDKYCPTF